MTVSSGERAAGQVLSRRGFLVGAAACVLCGAAGVLGDRNRRAGASSVLLPTLTEAERAAAQPDGIFHVSTGRPYVGLTFDDGPDPHYTPHVLDLLARYDATATFFLVGVNAARHRSLVARELRAGCQIGNHTFDHADLELLGATQVAAEIDGGERALVAAGAPRPTLFRPPKGYTDEAVGVIADAARYRTVFWGMCVESYIDHLGLEGGVTAMLDTIDPGTIVLAHDGGHVAAPGHPYIDRSRTMDALPLLLEGLRRKGLHPVSMAKLLRDARV